MLMIKRVDSLSYSPQPLAVRAIDGISVTPSVSKITASHFTAKPTDDELEPKRVHLIKVIDYYGAPELDPALI